MPAPEDYADPATEAPKDASDAPVAFISYSNDSKQHRAWVAALAVRLVDKGVDVLFDGFDVGPGDDVVKFMENSVEAADHVLMVCTETYVRKADDGKGGVGYEVMIVTGELIRDLGTSKFIPVICQHTSDPITPKCVRTRNRINLSEGADFEEEFDRLLRHIHQAPKLRKPPLGSSPYAKEDLAGQVGLIRKEQRRLDFAEALSTPEATYECSLEIIRVDDRVAWRRLLRASLDRATDLTRKWMNENPVVPANSRTDFGVLLDHANLGVGCFESLIACLLAAAETGREQYSGQLGWIDEIRRILSWPQSGLVYWVNFRDTVLFVTQALIGGKLLECGEGKTAYNLATTKVEDRYGSQSLPVYKHTLINGWPDSLGHTCTIAWSFLTSIIENWRWLKHASGSPETIKEGIVAYYFLMDFLGFVSKAKEGPWKVEPLSTPITAPQNFFAWPANAVNRGYAYFLNQIPLLRQILDSNDIDEHNLEVFWKLWLGETLAWLAGVFPNRFPAALPNANLPKDLRRNGWVL